MNELWTCFSLATGMVLRHFEGPDCILPPYQADGTWMPGRFSRGSYRLVDGQVVERPPVPFVQTGTPVADGVGLVTLSGLPAGTHLDMLREEGTSGREGFRVESIFVGPVTSTLVELCFTRSGTYRLILVNDPEYRPTTVLIEVPAP